MSTITLTLTSSDLTATRGAESAITAAVTNASTVPARVVLGGYPPLPATAATSATLSSAATWTVVDRPLREIAAGATETFTVTITPPPDAAAGEHVVRLIAYDADRAPEEYSDQAQQVRVRLPAETVAPPPTRRWWIWVALGLLVVTLAVVAFLWLRPSEPTPTPPSPATPTLVNPCPEPFVPRLARPDDMTCVMPASAEEAQWDNREDVQRNRVIPGTDPPQCAIPYVPRLAFPDDFICVWEDTANRTHVENQQEGYLDHQFDDSQYPEVFTPRR